MGGSPSILVRLDISLPTPLGPTPNFLVLHNSLSQKGFMGWSSHL